MPSDRMNSRSSAVSVSAASSINLMRSSNMSQSFLQCATQQLAKLSRQLFELMNHDRIPNDRAQAVIQDSDTDQLDAGRFDSLSDVLSMPHRAAVVALATGAAIGSTFQIVFA